MAVFGYNNYYPNNNLYLQDLQAMRDKIDNQMRHIQMQNQQQPLAQQPITQNFQLAPQQPITPGVECFIVENADEVKNRFVSKLGIFVNKDYSTVWIKDPEKTRAFRTTEIIELDEKDQEILMLRKQISDMKEEIANANTVRQSDTSTDGATKSEKSPRVSDDKQSNAK